MAALNRRHIVRNGFRCVVALSRAQSRLDRERFDSGRGAFPSRSFESCSKISAFRDANVLQNNIVQTAGSAGESIAFGLGVTMPAILILGFDLEITRVMLVAILGGLLGILMMIPLRRALIVAEHGILKYPEGTACAEVLKAAASKESLAVADKTHTTANAQIVNEEAASGGGKVIFSGFGIGFLYQAAMGAFRMWKDTPEKIFGAPLKGGSISATIEPALLGVGYIIGPRIASIMCAGGVLSYLVLIPAIKFFGEHATMPIAPGTIPISEMGPDDIRGAYILYIGAGAVAAGGIISLFRSIPTIWHGLRGGLADLRGHHGPREHAPRTDRDLSMRVVIIGCLAIIAVIMAGAAIASARKSARRVFDRSLWLSFRHRVVTIDWRDRLVFKSDFRNDGGDAAAHLFGVSHHRLDHAQLFCDCALDRRHCLYRRVQRRHDVAGFENGFSGWIDPEISTNRDPVWRARFRAHAWFRALVP